MSDSRFQPGVSVRDNNSRVGRVVGDPMLVELDGNTVEVFTVDFWGTEVKRPDSWLTLLAPDSPESLLLHQPEALAAWAEDAPLKLVALALSVGGGTGKVADIRAKLDERVLEAGKWENWWKKQPQQMRKLPACFKITKVGRDSEYSLLTYFDAVPVASEIKAHKTVGAASKGAPTLADWREWLSRGTHGPAPGRFPTKPVADALAKWPEESVEQALLRVILSSEEALSTANTSAQTAEGWLKAVAQASLRWREIGGSDPRGYTAARVGEVLARLARVAGDRTPQELLLQAGALDGATDAWRRGFLAGMWDAFEGEDARDLYRTSSATLGRQARGDLAREIFLAAFTPDFSERRHSGLDRLLDSMPEDQRQQLLQEVIATANAGQRASLLHYISQSRHAEGVNREGLRLMASLLLGDGTSEFEDRVSRELADALEPKNHSVNADPVSWSFSVSTPTVTVLRNTQQRLDSIVAVNNAERTELQASHEDQLEQEKQEQERLRQQVRERNAELAANREESRLELRQDMLLAVGEVLQSLSARSDRDGLAGDVAAGLLLALRAGGAEPLGVAGERVPYNKEEHSASENIQKSGTVKIIAPGVIYRGGVHGDRILLKALVKHEAG